MILKHPVTVAIIAGFITYNICNHMNKNKKKKHKKYKKQDSEKKIIISMIVALVVWFLMSCYNTNPNYNTPIKKISDSIDNIVNNGIVANNDQIAQTGGQRTVLSKTYNVLGTGINIPQEGLNIPEVLIDYV